MWQLLWMSLLLVLPTREATRKCHIRWLGQLGRWSLLDVMVVLLLLIVLADQQAAGDGDGLSFAIGASVREGLFLFPLAILCSIGAVAILEMAVDPVQAAGFA